MQAWSQFRAILLFLSFPEFPHLSSQCVIKVEERYCLSAVCMFSSASIALKWLYCDWLPAVTAFRRVAFSAQFVFQLFLPGKLYSVHLCIKEKNVLSKNWLTTTTCVWLVFGSWNNKKKCIECEAFCRSNSSSWHGNGNQHLVKKGLGSKFRHTHTQYVWAHRIYSILSVPPLKLCLCTSWTPLRLLRDERQKERKGATSTSSSSVCVRAWGSSCIWYIVGPFRGPHKQHCGDPYSSRDPK